MFKSAMRFLVSIIMLCLATAKRCHMFLQVCLREKEAGAMRTFEIADVAVLLLSHRYSSMDVYEDLFAVKFRFVPLRFDFTAF
jgi:hypothetical protein